MAVGAAQKIEQALRLMDRGNIIEARTALQSAKNISPGAVVHALGRTYDPYYLSQIPEIDAGSEVSRAAAFYREALSRGVSAAASDLDRLHANYRIPR